MTDCVTARGQDGRTPERIGFGPRFLAPVLIGSMLNPINSTMIATALVPIGRTFHAGSSATAWLVAGLYLVTAIAQPVAGRVADRFGPRRVYIAGLLMVAAAGVGGYLAPSLPFLVGVRAVIGLGTSTAYPAAMSMVRTQSERLRRPTPGLVLGGITMAATVVSAVGPVLGGVLVGLVGWRWTFLVNVPLALTGLVLTLRWLPRDGRRTQPSEGIGAELDPVGMLVFAGTLTTLLLLLMEPGGPTWYLLGACLACAAVLVVWELRARRPFLDLRMLARNRALTLTYVRNAAQSMVLYSMLYGYAQWLEDAHGYDPLDTGLLLVVMSGVAFVASFLGARRRRLFGPLALASVALVAGSLALLFVSTATAAVLLVLVGAVFGLPNGLAFVANQAAMYAQAPGEQIGTAAGLLRTSMYLGAIVSSSFIGIVFGQRATDAGLHTFAVVLTAVSAVVLVVTLLDRTLRPRRSG